MSVRDERHDQHLEVHRRADLGRLMGSEEEPLPAVLVDPAPGLHPTGHRLVVRPPE